MLDVGVEQRAAFLGASEAVRRKVARYRLGALLVGVLFSVDFVAGLIRGTPSIGSLILAVGLLLFALLYRSTDEGRKRLKAHTDLESVGLRPDRAPDYAK